MKQAINSFKSILFFILLTSAHVTLPMGKNIIIDTDAGPDDLMAIGYLLSHRDACVKAITIAGTGLSHCEKGKNNVRLLEALANVKNNVPIGLGSDVSCNNDQNPYPPMIREWVDDLLGITPEQPVSPQKSTPHHDAIQLLSDTIEQNAGNISILCIGALTNIATLIQQKPDIVKKIKEIVFMGGAFNVPGNAAVLGHPDNTHAEMNILADPHAAQTVFDAETQITLVPLDCTNTVPINLAFVDRFNKAIVNNNPVMKLISEIFVKLQDKGIIPDHYYAWDPLAAALVMNPELAEYKHRNVKVVLEQGNEYGRSIFTESQPEHKKLPLRIAMNPNAQRWENTFIKTLALYDPIKAFDSLAAKYLAQREPSYDNNQQLNFLHEKLGSLTDKRILEFGCGGGKPVLRFFTDRGAKVTGVDFSEPMIAAAQKNIPEGKFILEDMVTVQLPDATYDAAIAFYSLFVLDMEQQKALFEKMYRVLKDGGVGYFNILSSKISDGHDFSGFVPYLEIPFFMSLTSQDNYQKILQEIGFSDIQFEEQIMNNEPFLWVYVKKD